MLVCSEWLLCNMVAGLAQSAMSVVSSAPETAKPKYEVKVGSTGPWDFPDDTPACSFIDKDGTYYLQSSDAPYAIDDPRRWTFFTGADIDSAHYAPQSKAVNPLNPKDSNWDTTWRCNHSPTGVNATASPHGRKSRLKYSQANYCDLMGVWVDPDTGDWYGLVHNEFTPQPFGDNLHFDAIDYAVSKDQGYTWTIVDHAITSPYPTVRGDDKAFPHDTYYYGDGDPRLVVDVAGGYFYAIYGSRVISKGDGGWWTTYYEHAARAPLSGKLAHGWTKWYDGKWEQPGIGGKESNLVPVTSDADTGYTPPEGEYDPKNTGSTEEQIAAGKMANTTELFWMDVSYNAYLGLWIGEPNNLDKSGNAPQLIYACDDLTTQKWRKIGDTGKYRTKSAYRWLLDGVSKSSSQILGKHFRAYCSFGCSDGKDSEYVNLSIEGPTTELVKEDRKYTISSGSTFIASSENTTAFAPHATKFAFKPTGDGAYFLTADEGTLGLPSTHASSRAWGTKPVFGDHTGDVSQQWYILPDRSGNGKVHTGQFRLVSRYSGLFLALSTAEGRQVETTPGRSWTDRSGSSVGDGRKASEQILAFAEA